MDSKEFWEREARIMAHQADRRAFRAARIDALLHEPCDHPGCKSYVTHPCEGCGRQWGPREEDMPFKTTPEDVTHMFTYHPPKPEQIPKYTELREAAETFAQTILRLTPGCADQTAAIRKVREAVMTANAAIALEK